MMRSLGPDLAGASNERGFTLIELLVTLAGAMVIFVALLTILDISIHQTTRIVSRVDSTQEGRTAMSKLEQELHSTCVNGSQFGVQAGSTDAKLIFYSGYGGGPNVSADTHVITYTPGATYGTLTDDTYAPDGSLSGTETLLGRVTPRVDGNGNPIPIFQYFDYKIANDGTGDYHDPGGNPYHMVLDGNQTLPDGATDSSGAAAGGSVPANAPNPLNATPPQGLTNPDAGNTVEVEINMIAYANGGNDVNPDITSGNPGVVNSSGNSITDDVSLRLTPVGNFATPGDTYPCQ
jgi:Prokaryotic N-terminal methylation motif